MTKYRVVVIEKIKEVWEIEAGCAEEAENIALDGPHGLTARVVSQPEGEIWVDDVEEIEE